MIVMLLSVCIFSASCMQSNKFDEKKQVVITGKINQYNGSNAKLYLIYSQPGVKSARELVDIDSAGNFEYRIEGYLPLDAMLLEKNTFSNINFMYHPGDSIHLEFDTKEKPLALLKTVKFSGDRAETNNQILKFQVMREEKDLGYGAINPSESYKKNVADFIVEMDSVKARQVDIYNTFIAQYSPTKEAKEWAGLFASETYYYYLGDYAYEKKDVPDNYYDFTKEILPITLDKLVCWKVLDQRLNLYVKKIVNSEFLKLYPDIESQKESTNRLDSLYLRFLIEKSPNNLFCQLAISHYYITQFQGNIIGSYQLNQDLIKSALDAPFIAKSLQKSYEDTYEYINNPGELTGVILKKIENTPIEETFNKILEENKRKVIYMDCWATWCAPCRNAMPFSKMLMSKFSPKDVAFVYVCIESEEKVWRKLVSEFKFEGGQHYFLDKKQSEFFRDVMKVDGVPCYFLINKKGVITEQGFQLHPEEKLTEEKITKLKNE